MKIICILNNYSEIKTLNSELSFYLKPETSLLLNNRPFYFPEYTNEIVCGAELVLKINKVGKYISEKFAHTYYDEIGLTINMFAKDLQKDCIKNNIPWEVSSSFDNSSPISKFTDKNVFDDNIKFSLAINEEIVQTTNTSDLLFSFDKIVSHVSKYLMLKTGDLIFTGRSINPVKINIGDQLEGFINENCVVKCKIK